MHQLSIKHATLFLFLVFAGLMQACMVPGKLEKSNKLLVKNKVHLSKPIANSSELENFIQQKPNTKILGLFRTYLWVYRYSSQGKQNGIKPWLNRAIAEKPVFVDTLLSEMTARKMKLYLNNIGYFHATVKKDFKYRRHKATAIYRVTPGEACKIRNFVYVVKDSILRKIVLDNEKDAKIKVGDVYNAYTLDEERDRIAMLLKNKGYYAFPKEFLHYTVDTGIAPNAMDIRLDLNNLKIADPARPGQFVEKKHQISRIHKVFIIPDYDPLNQASKGYDSVTYIKKYESLPADTIVFLTREPIRLNPAVMARSVVVKPGDIYTQQAAEQTHDRLGDLQFFRLINVIYKRIEDSTQLLEEREGLLNCFVLLSRNPYNATSIGGEVTNTGGDFGMSMITTYENRNMFGGAELFTVSLNGAMEIRRNFKSDSITNTGLFNTFDGGFRASLLFPKFLLPVRQDRILGYFRPKTRINSGFNFEVTPDYRRYVADVAFGYEWKQSKTQRHILNPMEISSISIFKTDDFQTYLDSINDPWYSEQYTDHFIAGMGYSFIYNNQDINRKINFIYFRGNLQSAGNLFSVFNEVIPAQKNDAGKSLFLGIPYAQFLKVSGDFRNYFLFGSTTLVLRAVAGIGVAYGNSEALPFDRGFYAGGANGMRGWIYGSLGPGSYNDDSYMQRYTHMGDVQLETNIEYRFPFIGMFKGAIFTDIGNVWLLKSNDQFPDGDFGSNFMSQVGMDSGLGLRLDFSFFVFRLDGALQIRRPALPLNERWISFGSTRIKDITWNFGIGYPF